jgi:3-phenylpropionate/trans-cinnamate dioxygenase ferredoxin subunit
MYPNLGDEGVSEWVAVGLAENEVRTGEMRPVSAGDARLVVARLEDGSLVAFDESCTHERCPLSEGDLIGDRVICSCHGAAFEARTGWAMTPPAVEALRVYPVRVAGGRVQVRPGEPAAG